MKNDGRRISNLVIVRTIHTGYCLAGLGKP
jgi:hypothetical protein